MRSSSSRKRNCHLSIIDSAALGGPEARVAATSTHCQGWSIKWLNASFLSLYIRALPCSLLYRRVARFDLQKTKVEFQFAFPPTTTRLYPSFHFPRFKSFCILYYAYRAPQLVPAYRCRWHFSRPCPHKLSIRIWKSSALTAEIKAATASALRARPTVRLPVALHTLLPASTI